MPFTVTHSLAVIPIFKSWPRHLPLSALVIGAMVPDFPLFFSLGISYNDTHSILGVFTWCLLLGYAHFFLFHKFLKNAWIELLPEELRVRLASVKNRYPVDKLGKYLLVAVALVIGSATHYVWDSFTHDYGFGLHWFPSLKNKTVFIFANPVPNYTLFQYGSSVLGLPLLFLLFLSWYKRAHQFQDDAKLTITLRLTVIFIVVLAMVAAFVYVLLAFSAVPMNFENLQDFAFREVTTIGAAMLVVLLVYGLIYDFLIGVKKVDSQH